MLKDNLANGMDVENTSDGETGGMDSKPSTGDDKASERGKHNIFQEEGEHSCDDALNMFDSMFDSLEKGALSHLQKITSEKDKNKLPDLVSAYISSSADAFNSDEDDAPSDKSEEADDSFESAEESLDFELAIATPTTLAFVKIKPKNGPASNYTQFQASNSNTGLSASFEMRDEGSDGIVEKKVTTRHTLAVDLTKRSVKFDFDFDSFTKFNTITGFPGFDGSGQDSDGKKEIEVIEKSKATMEVGAGERKPSIRLRCVSDTRTESNSLMRYNVSPEGFDHDYDREKAQTLIHS